MRKIIEFINTLLLFIMYPSPEDRAKQIELKRIHRELRYLNLAYTGLRGKKVFPTLARKLAELHLLMEELKAAVDMPTERPELFSNGDLLEYMVAIYLGDSLKQQIRYYSYESLQQRMEESPNTDVAWQAIERDWQDVYTQLTRVNREKIDQDLFQLELLHSLSGFDFESFLRAFDRSYVKGKKEEAFNFHECERAEVETPLLDLYFLVGGLKLKPGMGELIRRVQYYYHPDFEEKGEKAQKIRDITDRLDMLFENELAGGTILSILRLLQQESEFEPEFMQPTRSYTAEARKRIVLRFEHARDRIQRDILDRRNRVKVMNLFGAENGFEEIRMYTEENEKRIHDRGMAGFRYLLPLEAIKTYQLRYYSGGISGSLRKLYEDGAFEDSKFKKALVGSIQMVSGITLQIEKFEADLTSPVSFSMDEVLHLLSGAEMSIGDREQIISYLKKINEEAYKISFDAAQAYMELNRIVEMLIDDHKSLKPRHIINMRVIGGERNRDIIMNIGKAFEIQKGLIEVLRSYTIVGEIRKEEKTAETGKSSVHL